MSVRTYGQNCGLARALDILGERWTLLILRELGMGPRRYKDLAAGLPGIGTNLLASRLQSLEQAGLIERVMLPAPASVPAYAIASVGEELRPILGQLAAWGLRHGAPFDEDDHARAEWLIQAMFATADHEAAKEFGGVVQLTVDGESAWIAATAEDLQLHAGVSPMPARLVLTTDRATLMALATEEMGFRDAVASGALAVEGPARDARRFLAIYSLPGDVA